MRRYRSGIYGFIIEYLIMILVLTIIAIVSMQIFVKGKVFSENAIVKNDALVNVENYSEKMQNYNGEALSSYLNTVNVINNVATIYIKDDDVNNSSTIIKLIIKVNNDNYYSSNLAYYSDDTLILSLDVISKGSVDDD